VRVVARATQAKTAGNAALQEGRLEEAMMYYNMALRGVDEHAASDDVAGAAAEEELFAVAVAVQLNIALTQQRMAEKVEAVQGVERAEPFYRSVVESTEIVLALSPGNKKAMYRRSSAVAKCGQRDRTG
jgi:tetratricopeptide (TPR) repeat protein